MVFLLRKWNSSHPTALEHLTPDLKDSRSLHSILDQGEYTKTLVIDWNPEKDTFRLTVADFPAQQPLTKCLLTSYIAKTFDVWGGFLQPLSRQKSYYRNYGNRRLIGTKLSPLTCFVPGVAGGWSCHYSLACKFLGVAPMAVSVSVGHSYTVSVMPPKMLMLLLCISTYSIVTAPSTHL